jgi:hypothetical protein
MEPHIGAPFVHWFRTGSPAQATALRLCHRLGFSNDPGPARDDWVRRELGTLGGHVFYRDERETLAVFSRHFELVSRGEADFIIDRVRDSRALRRFERLLKPIVFEPLLRRVCLRLAGVVLIMRPRPG